MKKLILGLVAAAAVAVAAPGLASAGDVSNNGTTNDAHGYARPTTSTTTTATTTASGTSAPRRPVSRSAPSLEPQPVPGSPPRANTPRSATTADVRHTCAPGSPSRGRRSKQRIRCEVPPSTQQEDKSERCSVRGGQSSAQIQYDRRVSTSKPTSHIRLGLAIAAMAMVPAVFWASVAWFVWGRLSAVIAVTVVLVVWTCTRAFIRSASGIETPSLPMLLGAARDAGPAADGYMARCSKATHAPITPSRGSDEARAGGASSRGLRRAGGRFERVIGGVACLAAEDDLAAHLDDSVGGDGSGARASSAAAAPSPRAGGGRW